MLIIVLRDFHSQNYDIIPLLSFNRNAKIVQFDLRSCRTMYNIHFCMLLCYVPMCLCSMHIQWSTCDVKVIVPIHSFSKLKCIVSHIAVINLTLIQCSTCLGCQEIVHEKQFRINNTFNGSHSIEGGSL